MAWVGMKRCIFKQTMGYDGETVRMNVTNRRTDMLGYHLTLSHPLLLLWGCTLEFKCQTSGLLECVAALQAWELLMVQQLSRRDQRRASRQRRGRQRWMQRVPRLQTRMLWRQALAHGAAMAMVRHVFSALSLLLSMCQ